MKLLTTFDPNDVIAAATNYAWLFSTMSISSLISVNLLIAISQAISKPSEIYKGWSPLSNKKEACSKNALNKIKN